MNERNGEDQLTELKKILSTDSRTAQVVDMIFKILSSRKLFIAFLDYENNQELFAIDGKQIEQSIYLRKLGETFGRKNAFGSPMMNQSIFSRIKPFPELEGYKKRYCELYDFYNFERFLNPMYEFRDSGGTGSLGDIILRENDEPDWTINPELKETVFGKMPQELTLEEKIMYIYCKLCKELSYDEGYFFRDYLKDDIYNGNFSKEELEGIKPGTKITCWSFSRLFAKFINQLEGDVEGVVVLEGGGKGHYLTGFYTDKVSAMVDAVNSRDDGSNDLLRAKCGVEVEGLYAISDRSGIIKRALTKVYPLVFGKEGISMWLYMDLINRIPREKIPGDLEGKMKVFLKFLNDNQIRGNEGCQILNMFRNIRLFGDNLEIAYVGEKTKEEGKKEFKRLVLARNRIDKSKMYSLDLNSLQITEVTRQDILDKLNSGEIIYERKEHRFRDIIPDEECK